MQGMTFALIAVAAVLLPACAVGPDFTKPDVPEPVSFRTVEVEGASIANLPWWELLEDESLQKLISTALEENKDLKRATATIEEYEARLLIARTDFIPQFSGTGNFTPAFGRNTAFLFPGFPNPFNYYLQGNLSWEIDIWGRIRRSNEAGRAELLAKEEARRAVILELVSNVAQAYFDLLQYDMQLDIARRTLLGWDESVRIAKARLRQGLIPKLDADQFEAERANAAARAAELERQVVQKENQLSVLIGRNPGKIFRTRSLTEQVMPPQVPAGLPSELLQRRPDIVRAEKELGAATARIGMAKADRFPKLTLTGIYGSADPKLSRLISPDGEFGVVGPSIVGPLLNAQILGFNQKAAEAQARQALAAYEQSVLVAFREVEDSLIAVKTSREQREAQKQQVDALRSALHLANIRYKGGLANYLDVLVAQRNLFDAELSLTSTHRLYLVSIVQLYKALGGGWPPLQEPAAPVPTTTDEPRPTSQVTS